MIIRVYAPIPDAPLAFARHWRAVIQLYDGGWAHAFLHPRLSWQVTYRDVQKGRISATQRDELNRLLVTKQD